MNTIKIFVPILLLLLFQCREKTGQQLRDVNEVDAFQAQREAMVSAQIQRRGIKSESVLRAMRTVPRHRFVPSNLITSAYRDYPLPIGYDQTISQPYIVALMTEQLDLKPESRVLEIGTGSGYQAAVLGEIAAEVYTIEIIPALYESARQLLQNMGYENVHCRMGDGYQGWPEAAPFDGIIVTAAPQHIPSPLLEQLRKGGRMTIPVGDYYQELLLIEKSEDGELKQSSVIPVRFVPMTGEATGVK
jgi:protein-L-isoaspartate(D-aspartate) O-methyltransferase